MYPPRIGAATLVVVNAAVKPARRPARFLRCVSWTSRQFIESQKAGTYAPKQRPATNTAARGGSRTKETCPVATERMPRVMDVEARIGRPVERARTTRVATPNARSQTRTPRWNARALGGLTR